MDILQFQKTWSPTDWDWTTTSSFTTLSEDEPLSAHRVLSDRKILSEVFQSLSHLPHVLSCAARVNKLWFEVSTDVVWEDVPAGGIRPILFTIPEYHESRGKPYLTNLPTVRSWTRFTTVFAPRMKTLHVDLKTLFSSEGTHYRPRRLLQDILRPAPDRLFLPQLRKLHAVLDLDLLHVDLLRRLSSPEIQHLSVEMYPVRLDQSDTDPALEKDRLFPVGPMLDFIWMQMPNLLSLRLIFPDAQMLSSAWVRFTMMLMKLKHLQTLVLPAFALPRALLPAITNHPSLEHISAYTQDTDSIWLSARDLDPTTLPYILNSPEDYALLTLPVPVRNTRIVVNTLKSLTICTHLVQLSELLCYTALLPNLQSLHVIPPQPILTIHEVRNFFEIVTARFPNLRSLDVSPMILACPDRIGYATLKSLRSCKELQSLTLRTTTPINIEGHRFEDLVSHWPDLRSLILDDSAADASFASQPALLPLGLAVIALQNFCPKFERLSVYAYPSLPVTAHLHSARTFRSSPWMSLKELYVRLGEPHVTPPRHVAGLLREFCTDGCGVKIKALPSDSMVELTEGMCDNAGKVMKGKDFVEKCLFEWETLVALDGKCVRTDWSESMKTIMGYVVRADGVAGQKRVVSPTRKLLGSLAH